MQYPLETYRAFGQHCAYAHRVKNTVRATDLFAVLWECLGSEDLQDHCDARSAFNIAFGNAYRSQWTPEAPLEPSRGVLRSQSGMIEGPDPDCDTPVSNVRSIGLAAVKRAVKDTPVPRKATSRTVADCAAFFRSKVEA